MADDPPIPDLALWEANMLSFGAMHCTWIDTQDPQSDGALAASYYDAIRVYRQIRAYTGNSSWDACITDFKTVYRDDYVVEGNGGAPGYWNFTEGLRLDYEAVTDEDSKTAAIMLSENGAYCIDGTSLPSTAGAERSREVAYCINAYINAELLGETRRTRLTQAGADNDLTDQALDHLDQWFVTKDFRAPAGHFDTPGCEGKYGYHPFMVALTVDALIRFWELTADSRVQTAVTTALDTMWTDAWQSNEQAFWYENCKTNPEDAWPAVAGSADLNLLIASGYAWLYTRTANTSYRDKADAIFAGGVGNGDGGGGTGGAYLWGSKQFNQNYAFSFDYVTYRSQPPPELPLGDLTISSLDTSVCVRYGAVALPYGADCTVTLNDSGGSPLDTAATTEGLAKRDACFTGLTASTVYGIAVACDGNLADVANTSFTTKAAPAGGNRTVPIQTGDPTSYPTAARATVEYDDNAALSTPATLQNTDCASGCTVNLTLAAGLWYYRWIWQTSGDATLATSAIQPLQVQ